MAFSLTSQLGLRGQPALARAFSFLRILIKGVNPREMISQNSCGV